MTTRVNEINKYLANKKKTTFSIFNKPRIHCTAARSAARVGVWPKPSRYSGRKLIMNLIYDGGGCSSPTIPTLQ